MHAPGERQHLFIVNADGGDPRDLTPGDRDAVPTSTTFSAGDEFDFSPDGKEIVYTATPFPNREEAWSTNHDLYSVNLETGERRQITTNPAADGLPRFSPDGKFLAYRAQARAGFEADRWQLILLDRATGQRRSLTEQLDSWVESIVWSSDSKTIYFDAEEKGTKPIWSVAVSGGSIKKCVEGEVNGDGVVVRMYESLGRTASTALRERSHPQSMPAPRLPRVAALLL
jgi:Tol biopolymer transport system component